jgi:hypothetical protein
MTDPMHHFSPQALERGTALADALDDILEGCAKLADAKAGTETIAAILRQVADTIEQHPGD